MKIGLAGAANALTLSPLELIQQHWRWVGRCSAPAKVGIVFSSNIARRAVDLLAGGVRGLAASDHIVR
jgi:hypothetical protein